MKRSTFSKALPLAAVLEGADTESAKADAAKKMIADATTAPAHDADWYVRHHATERKA
jgi:hypothetical protein